MLPIFFTVHDRDGHAKLVNASHIETVSDDGTVRTLHLYSGAYVHGVVVLKDVLCMPNDLRP